MKIHVFDTDPRRFTEPEKYEHNFGSFAAVARGINSGLKTINCYAEPDDADFVGVCDGLMMNFKYKDKKPFIIHVWDVIDQIPQEVIQSYLHFKPILLGLSDQVSQNWSNYGIKCETVEPGVDTNFWKQTLPKNEKFTFLFNNFSNCRSGLDCALAAFEDLFFKLNNEFDCKLIIKNTNGSAKLHESIKSKQHYLPIEYINARMTIEEMRDLYSRSHVLLNTLRMSSWGLNSHEACAANCLPVMGNFSPSNRIVSNGIGLTVPVYRIDLNQKVKFLESIGFHNSYGNFTYDNSPEFYGYPPEQYSDTLHFIINNYNHFASFNQQRIEKLKHLWSWERSANMLVNALHYAS